jgi:outer membrane protein assembly factor BamA
MWGVGHSLSLRTRASTRDRRALLNYSWPRVNFSPNLNLSFTALYQRTSDIRTATVRRAEVSAQLSQRLSKPTTIFYRFSYRRVGVSDLKVTTFLLGQLTQPVRVGLPSISIVQDRRDDPIEPHHGLYNTLDLGIADRAFGSQRNFLRVLLRNASYHPLGKRLVLARSTQFGNIYSYRFKGKPDEAVPLAERFFAGGGTSHRGFPEFGAGPRDISTGFPLGGRSVLFNQTELRFPLVGEDFGGVLFHDAGNVYSKLGNLSVRFHQRDLQDFDYAVHAVGFGIRYRTPIGPVRADFGYTLNPPYFFGFEGSTQDLISAGANPCSPPPGVPNRCSVQNVSHFQWVLSIGQTF